MGEKGNWEEFAASGKVMDYLEYKGCIDRALNLSDTVTGSDIAGNVLFVEENERKKEKQKKEERFSAR